jgi:hypothetical protein
MGLEKTSSEYRNSPWSTHHFCFLFFRGYVEMKTWRSAVRFFYFYPAKRNQNLKQIMANHDPNHSSKEKTILWTIIVATLGLALLFMKANSNIQAPREALTGDAGLGKTVKKEMPAIAEPAHAPADSTHQDTTHTGASHAAPAH